MPVEMPPDFVVRDVDGTTRVERPKSRPEVLTAPRPRRSEPAVRRGPTFVMPVEFWLIFLVIVLVALYLIVRLFALSSG